MADLTLNTDVIVIASGKSDKRNLTPVCIDLLNTMRDTPEMQLVLDRTKKIQQEYENKVPDPNSFGKVFVIHMLTTQGKTNIVDRAKGSEWHRVRVSLSEAGMHSEDLDFVRAAMMSDDKVFVAEEAHLHRSKVAQTLRQKAGVRIKRIKDMV